MQRSSSILAVAIAVTLALAACDPAGAAVPGTHPAGATAPQLLRYGTAKEIPAAQRAAVFSEYVEAFRAAQASGDYARAHELATHATRLYPQVRRTWNHQAAACVRLAQWSPAIEAARKAETARDDRDAPPIAPDESHAGAAYWEGVALYSTQRYPEALLRLRAARTRAPSWGEAARALAECAFVSGDAKTSAAEYASAFDLDPDLGTARDLSYFADARASTGDLAGGIAAIQEALRRAPFEPGLNAKMGDLLRREGRISDAYYTLLYEVTLQGLESPFARPALAMQEELVRNATLKHEDHDHTKNPTPTTPAARAEADAHEILAVAKGLRTLDGGSTHGAAKLFEHALSGTRSSSPMPYILYADALLRDKQAAKAQQAIDMALQTHADCVPALWVLAEAQRAQGQTAKADATIARIQALYPNYWRLTAAPTAGG